MWWRRAPPSWARAAPAPGASFQQQGEAEDGALLPRSADRVYPGRAENWVASAGTEEDPLRERPFQEWDAGDLADRLWAAWGNR